MVLGGHFGSIGHTKYLDPATGQRATNIAGRFVNELDLDFSGCWAGEPFSEPPPYENCACDPDCTGNHFYWSDGRSSAVARLIRIDPIKNRVEVKHWSCESEPSGGFWLRDWEIPGSNPSFITEGTNTFSLFD
jgi:hypothetical protein